MEIIGNAYMPGDPRLIDHIVYELKAQGIFDQFRKECISDVDTKPAYQNLRQRVEGNVTSFLKTQQWSADMNKNQVREMLRKNISESGFLETGVERIVDQVVNPKINTVFLPQVENVVYKFLGIERPSHKNEKEVKVEVNKPLKVTITPNDLLPNDLEAISPESETTEKKIDQSFELEKADDNKMDEDESPPFEPLEMNTSQVLPDENSVDSHFSDIVSHDSNHSADKFKMDISNQDSQVSKQSSGDGHLSIDYDKMNISEESSQSRTKLNDTDRIDTNSNSLYFNLSKNDEKMDVATNSIANDIKNIDIKKNNESTSDEKIKSVDKKDDKKKDDRGEKTEEKEKKENKKTENGKSRTEDKKSDKHRSSDKHKSHRGKYEKENDRKDKDKKENKEKLSLTDSKERKSDKDKSKSDKDKTKDDKTKDKDKSKSDKDKVKDDKNSQNRHDKDKLKTEKEKSKVDKSDKSSKEKSDKDKSKSDKNKDKIDKVKSEKGKNDKDKRDDKDKSKENREKTKENKDKVKDKEADKKDKSSNENKHRSERTEEDKHASSKNKNSRSSSKDNEQKEKSSKESKSRDKSESGMTKDEAKHKSKTSSKSESNKKDDKHKKDDKCLQSDKSKKEQKQHEKSKKDSKRDAKKSSKDDHYSLKDKKWDRRSTDRDSSDGRSGNQSSQSSFSEAPQKQNRVQESSSCSGSGSGDSGNSDDVEGSQDSELICSSMEERLVTETTYFKENLQAREVEVKLIKPKFASNIFEAKRLMKIRKQLNKLEKQKQNFFNSNKEALNVNVLETNNSMQGVSITKNDNKQIEETAPLKYQLYNRRRSTILKKTAINSLNLFCPDKEMSSSNEKNLPENKNEAVQTDLKIENKNECDELVPPPLANQVISKESWDALEAKLSQQNLLNMDYSSYTEYSDSDSPTKKEDYEEFSQSFSKALSKYYEPKEQMPSNNSKIQEGNKENNETKEEFPKETLESNRQKLEEMHDKNSKKKDVEGQILPEPTADILCDHKEAANEEEQISKEQTMQQTSETLPEGNSKVSSEESIIFREEPTILQSPKSMPCSEESVKKTQEEQDETDTRYFSPSDVFISEKHILILKQSVEKMEQEINLISSVFKQRRKTVEIQTESTVKRNVLSDSNKVVNSKTKNSLIEMTRNNQMSTSIVRRGRKRKDSEYPFDVHNNNKINNHITDTDNIPPGQLNDTPPKNNKVSPNSKNQAKKFKNQDDGVIATNEKYSLPLSPSESEHSFGSEKKELEPPKSAKRKSNTDKLPTKLQRYSSDDLYKPRLNFSSRRRSEKVLAND